MGNELAGNIPASTAHAIWESIQPIIAEVCERVMLCGSLRRKRPYVHDIDIVVIPRVGEGGYVPLHEVIVKISDAEPPDWVSQREALYKNKGRKMVCVQRGYIPDPHMPCSVIHTFVDGVQLDIYEQADPAYFWPEVVVRTGPQRRKGGYGPDDPGASNNIALANRARRRGMTLSMSGGGLQCKGERVGYESEQAFYAALSLPFCPPELRDHPHWIRRINNMCRSFPGAVWQPKELGL